MRDLIDVNTTLQSNLKALSESFPSVHSDMVQITKNIDSSSLQVTQTKNNLINFSNFINDSKKFIHSNYNPYKEGETLTTLVEEEDDTIVVLGFGLGYHIEALIEKFPHKNKLIIEPDIRMFGKCIMHRDITHIIKSKNISLVLGADIYKLLDNMKNLFNNSLIYNVRFVALSYHKGIYGNAWQMLQNSFEDYRSNYFVGLKTRLNFNKIWLSNFFSNLKFLHTASQFNNLKTKFNDMPAILVLPGPSLSKSIHMLKGVEDKAIVVAVSSVVKALLLEGIIPHIVVSIDGSEEMKKDFEDLNRDDVILAYIFNLYPECVRDYSGPRLYLKTKHEPHVDYFEESIGVKTETLYSGPSVSNISLDMLYEMGCDPIVVVGQDLAFTDLKTHTDNASDPKDVSEHLETLIKSGKGIYNKDMFGNDILTTRIFLNMKEWIERYIEDRKDKRKFINSTTAGLEIKNMEVMPLEEVKKKYFNQSRNIREELLNINKQGNIGNKISKDKISEFIVDTNKSLDEIESTSKERINKCEYVIENIKKGNNYSVDKELKEINNLTRKLEQSELCKTFVLIPISNILTFVKNEAEALSFKEKEPNKRKSVLFEGLLKQFYYVHEQISFLKIVTNTIIEKGESFDG